MKYTIKQFSKLTGVSVRTLHYYDEIDLLNPEFIESNNYRYYSNNSLIIMQEILFYKELDFSLKEIKDMLLLPNYNKKELIKGQKRLLLIKQKRIERILQTLDNLEQGDEINMNIYKNNELEYEKNKYQNEVKEKYGNTNIYNEYVNKTKNYDNNNWNEISQNISLIIKEFSINLKSGININDRKTIDLVIELQKYITKTQYTCSDDILLSLGNIYVNDVRF